MDQELGKVDWNFIKELEGNQHLKGYVPKNREGKAIGHSGVTIASGVDLGQMDLCDLVSAVTKANIEPYPLDLLLKVKKYLVLRGDDAIQLLEDKPLTVTKEEADILDWVLLTKTFTDVEHYFHKATNSTLKLVPKRALTVLMSLAYNFGSNLPKALPNTWLRFIDSFKSGDWGIFWKWMDEFDSKNPELVRRRKKEADYLKELLTVTD